jgi:hypothetical protein
MNMNMNTNTNTAPTRLPRKGDILVCSWGYDQTNVDYYQVVDVTAKSIRIREIQAKVDHGDANSSTVKKFPVKDAFVRPTGTFDNDRDQTHTEKGALRRFRCDTSTRQQGNTVIRIPRYSVSITDYSSAYLWDGVPHHETSANFGH